eukprot:6828693-Prymnesium_polylepis.1
MLQERERSGLGVDGFTTSERAEPNCEKRRKDKQERETRESEQQAKVDAAPAQAALRELQVTPAWWLVVPLTADADAIASSIDWAHVKTVRSYSKTCDWPTIDERQQPLVKQHLKSVPQPAGN